VVLVEGGMLNPGLFLATLQAALGKKIQDTAKTTKKLESWRDNTVTIP